MKIINNKKSIKLIVFLIALLITLTLTEAVIKFAKTYEYQGFVKKGSETIQDIHNERAIALQELDACIVARDAAREAASQPLTINDNE